MPPFRPEPDLSGPIDFDSVPLRPCLLDDHLHTSSAIDATFVAEEVYNIGRELQEESHGGVFEQDA